MHSLRLILAAPLLLAIGSAAPAHDLWLQPERFMSDPGGAVAVTVLVGHGAERARWRGDASRVLMLERRGPDGTIDLRGRFRAENRPHDLIQAVSVPGVHVIAMRTNHAVSVLAPTRFEAYLKEEGLDPILAARAQAGKRARPGREIYSRRAKALIAVGPMPSGAEAAASTPIGFDLEIVPERNPFALGADRNLPVHVVFNGQRLEGALVQLTDLARDTKPISRARTDRSGRATFAIPRQGKWLLNVVWSIPLANDQRADYDTIFSSLAFGSD